MMWFGKAIGAALGMAVGGPFTSMLGALIGHQFDAGLQGASGGGARSIQGTFFEVTFEVMGHLAKIDGRVSEDEVRVARRIMHAMNLGPEQVQAAIGCFTRGKKADYALRRRLTVLGNQMGSRPDLARAFVEIQMQAAVGGGPIDAGKRRLLGEVAAALGVAPAQVAQIEALLRGTAGRPGADMATAGQALADAYRSLGVDGDAPDSEVKAAYRRLMSQNHPDKLVSRGLPASMMSMAEAKTRELTAAYDRIKAARNIK